VSARTVSVAGATWAAALPAAANRKPAQKMEALTPDLVALLDVALRN